MFRQRFNSFKYAFAGLWELVRSQPNMRIHLVAGTVVVVAGFFFGLSAVEWCFVIAAITAVLSAEAFNTALEYLTDLVSPEYHPLAGKVKDVAAAGVLVVAIGAAIIGVVVFLPRVLEFLG